MPSLLDELQGRDLWDWHLSGKRELVVYKDPFRSIDKGCFLPEGQSRPSERKD